MLYSQPLDKVDKALGNSTLNMLVNKWETIVKCNFGNARSDEENKKQTRYKFLRKQLMEIKLPIEWEVEEYPTVPVQRTALLMPKSDVMSNTPKHTITSITTSPQKASQVSDATLASGVSCPPRGEVRVKGLAAKLNQFVKQTKAPAETPSVLCTLAVF